jgi:quinol monooxygenase YgiN
VNEGQKEAFLELFRTLKSVMTKHESGNVYCDLYRSRKSARTYVVTERYRDEAAFHTAQSQSSALSDAAEQQHADAGQRRDRQVE